MKKTKYIFIFLAIAVQIFSQEKIIGKKLNIVTVEDPFTLNHPILNRSSIKIENPDSIEIKQLAKDMLVTAQSLEGDSWAGIAAPQVGNNVRMILYRIPKEMADSTIPNGVPPSCLINPTWYPLNDEKVAFWEQCVSMPRYVGKVSRYRNIVVYYQDLQGRDCYIEAHGCHSVVLQHEIDHLDGILYPQHIKSSINSDNFGLIDDMLEKVKSENLSEKKR
jgi:peptide deformylase